MVEQTEWVLSAGLLFALHPYVGISVFDEVTLITFVSFCCSRTVKVEM